MKPWRGSRRSWLRSLGGGAVALATGALRAADAPAGLPRVAVILTSFYYRSHAHVILENFLVPYLFCGRRTEPGCRIVACYADQFPANDMARDVCRQFDIPLFPSIAEALCVGGERLAVDAVVAIGEHGVYPFNELGQELYPRKAFFDAALEVMRRSDRYVPYFNDKYLSHRFDEGRAMVEAARTHGFPLMAGSSVPLAERRPPIELPAEAQLDEALAIHGGPVERYDFHGLEVLQAVVEARRGGETGVRRVTVLEGDAVWQAAAEGRFARALAEAAMRTETEAPSGPLETLDPEPRAILIEYRDGLRATVLKLGGPGGSTRFNIACRLRDRAEPWAFRHFVGPWNNRNLFKALAHAIQTMIRTGRPPYPVERTLLVGGVLEAFMRGRRQLGQPVETPELDVHYRAVDYRALCETGASWRRITEATPQPAGIAPVGLEEERGR